MSGSQDGGALKKQLNSSNANSNFSFTGWGGGGWGGDRSMYAYHRAGVSPHGHSGKESEKGTAVPAVAAADDNPSVAVIAEPGAPFARSLAP